MSLPRQVLAGRFFLITRRCTQRLFLLRPDAAANLCFLYCLAEAAQRFGIVVLLPSVMSNHHHTVIYDPHGHVCEFVEHFHKMLAKSMNVLRGRWENFFSSAPPSIVELVDRKDLLEALEYAATNPVKDGLVESVADWPGVNGLEALLSGRVITTQRPGFFFRDNGPMPRTVDLALRLPDVPEVVGDHGRFLDDLRASVASTEARYAAERAATGRRVLGRRRVLRQSWRDSPTSHEPRRGLQPRVAARSKWSRIEVLLRNRQFLRDYRAARAAWLAGEQVTFPAGTYWLRRFANVTVAAPVTPDPFFLS